MLPAVFIFNFLLLLNLYGTFCHVFIVKGELVAQTSDKKLTLHNSGLHHLSLLPSVLNISVIKLPHNICAFLALTSARLTVLNESFVLILRHVFFLRPCTIKLFSFYQHLLFFPAESRLSFKSFPGRVTHIILQTSDILFWFFCRSKALKTMITMKILKHLLSYSLLSYRMDSTKKSQLASSLRNWISRMGYSGSFAVGLHSSKVFDKSGINF